MPPQAKAAIISVQNKLTAKKLTEEGKSRRKRITEKHFFKENETRLILYFYQFGLEALKRYVCLFQSNEPLVNKLAYRQVEIFREMLSNFVKPEKLGNCSA